MLNSLLNFLLIFLVCDGLVQAVIKSDWLSLVICVVVGALLTSSNSSSKNPPHPPTKTS
jgi:hypothetical protein